MITLRFDTQMLARVDAAAKRLGISRSAWLQLAAGEVLEPRMPAQTDAHPVDSENKFAVRISIVRRR
jgi:hypothetical protein